MSARELLSPSQKQREKALRIRPMCRRFRERQTDRGWTNECRNTLGLVASFAALRSGLT
jgi:hypothetical protein